MSETIKIILTSSVIATILSVLVSAIVSLLLKNLDYKNEYYKKILEKRLEAYKFLETQIAVLKSSVLDDDGKPYYLIFEYGHEKFDEFQQNLFVAHAYSIWIDNETVNKMDELNRLFLKITRKLKDISDQELIQIGKDNYHEIAKIRTELESCVRNDLLELYDLKAFRKSKAI
jgi:phosphate/sulfate permease